MRYFASFCGENKKTVQYDDSNLQNEEAIKDGSEGYWLSCWGSNVSRFEHLYENDGYISEPSTGNMQCMISNIEDEDLDKRQEVSGNQHLGNQCNGQIQNRVNSNDDNRTNTVQSQIIGRNKQKTRQQKRSRVRSRHIHELYHDHCCD